MKNKIIAYQGIQGAYSHLAYKNVFPQSQAIGCETFQDAMQLVESGEADFAMIPIENSTAGRVEEIYRLIPKMQLHILDEHFEAVKHCLLVLQDAKMEDIKYISSHPQALAQCHIKLTNLNLEPIAKFDTAGAAREIKELNNIQHAAVASSLTSELYNLKILDDDFGDFKGNTTRFLILSKQSIIPIYDKNISYITSLVFSVRNIPSALFKALGGFATNGINLIKLESYSMTGSMDASQFHVDIDGHTDEKNLQLALDELRFFANEVKILGVYKRDSYRDKMKMFEVN
ncbi:MAG: prephenate dehydratase [Arcobacteraceae bacterium]|nr:prephenate dehydratase [Arcobacteraceae bacterium]